MKEKALALDPGDLVDLHCHSLLSDGAYLPMELVRRAWRRGYRALAITDHVDSSNLDRVIPEIVRAAAEINPCRETPLVLPGAEITHAPPETIPGLVRRARRLGARLVVVHGESTAEPVAPGTNRQAVEAGADILAHPGLVDAEVAGLAAARGIRLEISRRAGHCLANGRLVSLARETGVKLVVDTDGHREEDLFTPESYLETALGAGLSAGEIEALRRDTVDFVRALVLAP